MTIGGSFQNSLETTSLLKELGAKLVISRAERDVQEKFLLRNGADKVVYPEKQVAKWASIRYTDDHILDYMEVDASHAIFEVEVPEEWTGKTVGGLDIRKRYNINILAVKMKENLILQFLRIRIWKRIVNYWCWENTELFRSASAYSTANIK